MSFLKTIFAQKPLPPIDECTVEFTHAPSDRYAPSENWLKQIATFPFTVVKRIYNTYLLIRHAELREPAKRNMCPMRLINTFPSLFFTTKVTANPSIMKAILKHPRKDQNAGLFDDRENAKVFLPLLKDLYPSEKIGEDDFLLTCNTEFVHSYRQPILKFIGPQNIKKHGTELENIVEDTVKAWGKLGQEGKVNATALSLTFTTNVISQLLLGHPGPSQTYTEIAYAIDFLNKYVMKKTWKHPISTDEKCKYEKALETVRKAIDTSLNTLEKPHLGSLVDAMREEKEMPELKIKSTLFLMYLGGSETTASLLNYLLWQLGQHPEYQEEILQEISQRSGSLFEIASSSESIDRLFVESIRLFTPAYVIGRQPNADLICSVKNKQGEEVFREKIAKHEGILSAPTFAARDPSVYVKPGEFNPHRFTTPPKTLPWLPFGDGKHACPGQWLAKSEILVLVTALVKKYEIKSFPGYEIKQKGYMTLKPAEDVWITLTDRKLE